MYKLTKLIIIADFAFLFPCFAFNTLSLCFIFAYFLTYSLPSFCNPSLIFLYLCDLFMINFQCKSLGVRNSSLGITHRKSLSDVTIKRRLQINLIKQSMS